MAVGQASVQSLFGSQNVMTAVQLFRTAQRAIVLMRGSPSRLWLVLSGTVAYICAGDFADHVQADAVHIATTTTD